MLAPMLGRAKRLRWRPWVLGGLVLGLVAATVTAAGWKSGAETAKALGLRTASVERRDIAQVIEATGRLEPPGPFAVIAGVSGQLQEIVVRPGDRVEAGTVLARLDARELGFEVRALEATRTAARAKVAQAEASLADVKDLLERTEKLAARGQASAVKLEEAQSAAANARAVVRAARAEADAATARLEAAQFAVERSEIKAPKSGVVLVVRAQEGASVGPAGPVLFEMAAGLDPLQLKADVGEADIGALEPGQRATFEVPAFPSEEYPASVDEVGLVAEIRGGFSSYPVILSAPNPDQKLRPGMTAAVRFAVAEAEDALVVREAALRYAPRDAPPAPPRSRVFVRRGLAGLDPVDVVRGVSDGVFVEVRPRQEGALRPGDAVVIGETVRGSVDAPTMSLGGGG